MNKLSVLAALAILLPMPRLFADLKANDPAPPLPQSLSVTVYRGETTWIPLRARGRLATDARFILRTQPQSGTLGTMRASEPGLIEIPYRHEDANGTGTDEFTFAVQSPGSPVSAPARVRIQIIERPSRFLYPERLESGLTLIGRGSDQILRIENEGGGKIEGTLKVPAPWSIRGSNRYSLKRGEAAEFKLHFAPNDDRDFIGRVTYSHNSKLTTLLHGEGVEPIQLQPKDVDLSHPERSPEQSSARVRVSNALPEAVTLTVTAPPFVEAPKSLEVPAQGTAELSLVRRSESLAEGEGKVILQNGDDSAAINVRAFPAPAALETQPTGVFAFGKIAAGSVSHGHFQIRNCGGDTTEILIETPRYLSLTGPRNLTLAPGQEQRVAFEFEPTKPGKYEESIGLLFDGKRFPLHFTADVTPAGTTASVSGAAAPAAPGAIGAPEPEPSPPAEPLAASFDKLFVSEQNYNEIKIAWKRLPNDAPASYRVNRRKLEPQPNGGVREVWAPVPNVTFGETADSITATLTHLNPGERLSIRIFSLNAEGQITAASPTFSVFSKPWVPRPWPRWLWFLPAIAFVGILLRFLKRQRQKAREADLERIDEFTRS